MKEHPIEGLMLTAMESIRSMIDVNTIVGEPMEIDDNITIIPISKVGFGLAAGGSEFKDETVQGYVRKQNSEEEIQYRLPFGGGARSWSKYISSCIYCSSRQLCEVNANRT